MSQKVKGIVECCSVASRAAAALRRHRAWNAADPTDREPPRFGLGAGSARARLKLGADSVRARAGSVRTDRPRASVERVGVRSPLQFRNSQSPVSLVTRVTTLVIRSGGSRRVPFAIDGRPPSPFHAARGTCKVHCSSGGGDVPVAPHLGRHSPGSCIVRAPTSLSLPISPPFSHTVRHGTDSIRCRCRPGRE